MKRYSEYKKSGVEWTGEIPKHWVTKKLRYFCSMKSGNGFSHDLQGKTGLEIPFFKVSDTNTPQNKIEMLYAQNTVSLQEVSDFKFILHKPNSIVFPKVGAALLLNKRNVLTQKSCIDNNMMSLYSNQSNHKFLYYAMLNVDFKRHYRVGGAVPSINESEVGNISIAYPTISEQIQIAKFLDRKTEQIDELIRIKERQIELLQEQRTALINQTVTKGLDPNVEMKPSGVEWIGEIPVHWEVNRLKYVAKILPSNVDKHIYPDETQVRLCNYTDVYYNDYITVDTVLAKGSCKESEFAKFVLREGDVIITKDSETPDDIGVPTYVKDDLDSVVCGYHLTMIRPFACLGEFVFRFIQSDRTRRYFEVNSNGITRYGLGKSSIENLLLPIPTNSEQQQIADFLNNKTQQIDELITAEQQKIELLKEYRQSLISEAVTGKIDVRNEV